MRNIRVQLAVACFGLFAAVLTSIGVVLGLQGSGGGIGRVVLDVLLFVVVFGALAGVPTVLITRDLARAIERLRGVARLTDGGEAHDQSHHSNRDREDLSQLADAIVERFDRFQHDAALLREEGTRLEALLAASADGMLALDAAGVVRFANQAAVSLFGPSVGRSYVETVRHHELAAVAREARGPTSNDSNPVFLEAGGVWIQPTLSKITSGGEWAALVSLRDVTAIRRAEITRRDFIANVSHELRTPLAGLKAVVETLQNGALDDRLAAEDFLERADAEVDRLVHLVDELLQLARLEAGMPMQAVEVDLESLLEGVVDRFLPQAERAGVRLELSEGGVSTSILADPARMGQAVGNLVHNAIKFTPAGGCVQVHSREIDRGIEIAVSDNGSGIDPVDLARVFERFYIADRARAGGGTGLGLAIVKHVVIAHGGNVDAESTPGVGSTFRIVLPASAWSALGAASHAVGT